MDIKIVLVIFCFCFLLFYIIVSIDFIICFFMGGIIFIFSINEGFVDFMKYKIIFCYRVWVLFLLVFRYNFIFYKDVFDEFKARLLRVI